MINSNSKSTKKGGEKLKRYIITLIFIVILIFSMNIVSADDLSSKNSTYTTKTSNNNYNDSNVNLDKTEIPFVENKGQIEDKVKYYADTFYGTVYVTNDSITHSIIGKNNTKVVIKEQFLDKNGKVITFKPTGRESGTAKVDYYSGNDPLKWKTGLNTWKTISLGEIYPGIEIILRANGANIEKLFIIKPKANPDEIRMQLLGNDQLKINSDGSLNINTAITDIQLSKPKAFQGNKNISVKYKLNGNTYSFQLGKYDTKKQLIIDPTLQYGTYIGKTRDNCGNDITVDNKGNIYIVGYTDSSSFPTTTGTFQKTLNGTYDLFIVKLTPNNQGTNDLKYSTYLGGTDYDYGNSIAIDNAGNIYITGFTCSENFPTTTGAYQNTLKGMSDAFIIKLTPNNQGTNDLKYSTYLGGLYDETGYGIAVDNAGNAYITGYTSFDYSYTLSFPTTTGAYQTFNAGILDAFIVKLSPNNQGLTDLKYSTCLGGGDIDCGYDITVDTNGNIYVTGYTWSEANQWESGFPTTTGAYQNTLKGMSDAFIIKLTPNNQGTNDLKYSTYLGESGAESGQGIIIDSSGNIYITGYTDSDNFPTTTGAYQNTLKGSYDTIVVKLSPNNQGLDDLKYSTYLGGSDIDYGWSIDSDDEGNIYITGYTYSEDYPVTPGAYQTDKKGGSYSFDTFISKLTLNRQGNSDLKYSSYLGGTGDDYGYSIFVDHAGNIYLTGYTYSTDFPTTSGAYQTSYHGSGNAFIVKFGSVADLSITKTANTHRVKVNETIFYTIIIQNKGPNTSFGIKVTDKLPSGLKYVSSKANYGSYDPKTGIWAIDYLPNNATAILTIKSTVEQSGTIKNTAQVSALTYDPIINDTSSTATIIAIKQQHPNNNTNATNATNATNKTNSVNAATIPMQDTGVPLIYLIIAFGMIFSGMIITKK